MSKPFLPSLAHVFSVYLMPFSPPKPLCSRVHIIGYGIHESCFPEGRRAVHTNTSVEELHHMGSSLGSGAERKPSAALSDLGYKLLPRWN